MASHAFVSGCVPVPAKGSFSSSTTCDRTRATPAKWTMGKKSKFGVFTPAVLASKLILGEKNLNKIRGKAISYHSQSITAFCEFTGAGPKMRTNLIRTAKNNGDTLGFLS